MVNKIPSYMISAGGKFAILSSRCHPASSNLMSAAAKDALESCGVESDDIYLIDCPADSLLPGMSREIAKSGSFAAVISLAVLATGSDHGESIRIGMAVSDFGIPVIPTLVPESAGDSAIALAAQKAARSAIELVNFSSMLSEFSVAQNFAELEDESEEAPAVAKPRAASTRRTGAGATTNGRRTKRKTQ
jgi:6,7-dimethyl-8-ribityllumazine synthase